MTHMNPTDPKPKAALFCNPAIMHGANTVDYVFAQGRRNQLADLCHLHPVIVTEVNFDHEVAGLQDLECIFSTWGMPRLTDQQVGQLPKLKAVFYAAGSVKGFAQTFLAAGVAVFSAWAANAVPVAEFSVAQILLSCKGYFRNTRDCRIPPPLRQQGAFTGPGNYGETVAIIGAGQIGRRMIALLKPFALKVAVVDPYLSEHEAAELGVQKTNLEEAFLTAYVISNHLPNLPTLAKVLNGRLFASMRPNATFINTGRGAQVNEPELIAVLQQRPDLTALLDVTDPEPPGPNSEFYTLPNVQLSSHIAGSIRDEVVRMADYMIEEFRRWRDGEPLRYAVTLAMLDTMA